ncbi:MAG: F0F1 ATP synthase subunit gamma [Planctomycetota bacterium]|jgi:ATP synthase F1 gamma subunit
MPSLQQLEKQIATIDGLRDVIHSMRSLAATYLRRAEERLAGLRAYSDTVGRAIEDCLFGRDIALPEEEAGGAAILVFFSEQGLCGRFNEVIADAAAERAGEIGARRFIVVGKRGPALIRREKLEVIAEMPSTTSPDGDDVVIHAVAKTVLGLREREAFGQLYLLYARYLSPGRIEPAFERVLPLDLSQWRDSGATKPDASASDVGPTQGVGPDASGPDVGPTPRVGPDASTSDVGPTQGVGPDASASDVGPTQGVGRRTQPHLALSRLELLRELVNEYTFITLFRAMTESLAGEHGMRLQSMEAAKGNIDDALEELQLQSRIQRQNEITSELLDVVSAAEGLGNV